MNCRACNAEILFFRMKGKPKPTPVNAEPVNVLVKDNGYPFLMKDGSFIRGFKIGDAWDDDPDANVVEAYESHFATCPRANDFRTRNKSGRSARK